MKFKIKELRKVVDHIRYSSGFDDESYVDIVMRDEDFEDGKMTSSLTFSCSSSKRPAQYDKTLSEISTSISIEVFPENENRAPRVSKEEIQILDKD